jgi:hypothetical protein
MPAINDEGKNEGAGIQMPKRSGSKPDNNAQKARVFGNFGIENDEGINSTTSSFVKADMKKVKEKNGLKMTDKKKQILTVFE